MEQILAPVVFNRHLTGDYWLIEIEAPGHRRRPGTRPIRQYPYREQLGALSAPSVQRISSQPRQAPLASGL